MNHNTPVAKAEMLIRKPVAEVFEAFINPDITSKFWFTSGSGRLQVGKHVQWDWEMYDSSSQVTVKAIEQNKRILVEWSADAPTTVEWIFTPYGDDATFVSITNAGFHGDEQAVVQQAIGSTEGFTIVLAGLKALLEHNIRLNLVGGEHQAYINELATSDVAEGRGVGTALIQACEQWAREQGYRILALSTGAANGRALGFYRHLGFRDEDVKLVKLLTESDSDNPNRQT